MAGNVNGVEVRKQRITDLLKNVGPLTPILVAERLGITDVQTVWLDLTELIKDKKVKKVRWGVYDAI